MIGSPRFSQSAPLTQWDWPHHCVLAFRSTEKLKCLSTFRSSSPPAKFRRRLWEFSVACPLSVTITTNPPRSRAALDFLSHVHQQPHHITQNVHPRARFILRGPDPRRRWRRGHRTYFLRNSTRLCLCGPYVAGERDKSRRMKAFFVADDSETANPTKTTMRLKFFTESQEGIALFCGHQWLSYVYTFTCRDHE